ncbi:unnamed protein product [Dovyalis caffra]|uniref:Uncharacterized protein n=1 Tax=Dovyalis caffra TaxID=77055 RepID=A0AAV1RD04_9ROSI|nr:unnamed protein product [Dovyalis caffra]
MEEGRAGERRKESVRELLQRLLSPFGLSRSTLHSYFQHDLGRLPDPHTWITIGPANSRRPCELDNMAKSVCSTNLLRERRQEGWIGD